MLTLQRAPGVQSWVGSRACPTVKEPQQEALTLSLSTRTAELSYTGSCLPPPRESRAHGI